MSQAWGSFALAAIGIGAALAPTAAPIRQAVGTPRLSNRALVPDGTELIGRQAMVTFVVDYGFFDGKGNRTRMPSDPGTLDLYLDGVYVTQITVNGKKVAVPPSLTRGLYEGFTSDRDNNVVTLTPKKKVTAPLVSIAAGGKTVVSVWYGDKDDEGKMTVSLRAAIRGTKLQQEAIASRTFQRAIFTP